MNIMFSITLYEIMMFEGSSVLWPAQRVTEGERVKETEENMYLG